MTFRSTRWWRQKCHLSAVIAFAARKRKLLGMDWETARRIAAFFICYLCYGNLFLTYCVYSGSYAALTLVKNHTHTVFYSVMHVAFANLTVQNAPAHVHTRKLVLASLAT